MSAYGANHQLTHDLADVTGVLGESQYWWWISAEYDPMGDSVPADWSYKVIALDPDRLDDEDSDGLPFTVECTVTHAKVVNTLDMILSGFYDAREGENRKNVRNENLPKGTTPVGAWTKECAQSVVKDPEHGHLTWDAWASDELLQLMTYGGIVF